MKRRIGRGPEGSTEPECSSLLASRRVHQPGGSHFISFSFLFFSFLFFSFLFFSFLFFSFLFNVYLFLRERERARARKSGGGVKVPSF